MNQFTKAVWGSVVVLCLWPGAGAFAQQEHPIDQVRANSRSHVGPFYMTPGLVLRDLGMDSNVFNQTEDPKSDFTFTLGPKVDIAVPFARRVLLKTAVGADLVYYQQYSSERSVNPRLSGRGEIFLNKISLFAEGSYLRTRQRPNFEIDVRSQRIEQFAGAGVGYQYSPKLSFEISARWADLEYDAGARFLNVNLQQTMNRESTGGAAIARYAITPKTSLVLRAETTRDRFENSPVRDADTFRIMPGVEFGSRALIFGSGYVGYRKFDTKSEALDDFRGVVASASLGGTILGRTTVIFGADRDVNYSFELFQPYYIVDSYGVTIRQRLVGRFDFTVGAWRHQYAYVDVLDANTPGPLPQRVDVTQNLVASVGYSFSPAARLGFGTTYWRRDSNSANFRDYDAFRTGISLNYGF